MNTPTLDLIKELRTLPGTAKVAEVRELLDTVAQRLEELHRERLAVNRRIASQRREISSLSRFYLDTLKAQATQQ